MTLLPNPKLIFKLILTQNVALILILIVRGIAEVRVRISVYGYMWFKGLY